MEQPYLSLHSLDGRLAHGNEVASEQVGDWLLKRPPTEAASRYLSTFNWRRGFSSRRRQI